MTIWTQLKLFFEHEKMNYVHLNPKQCHNDATKQYVTQVKTHTSTLGEQLWVCLLKFDVMIWTDCEFPVLYRVLLLTWSYRERWLW